jgi:AraC family transcriptional regulator of adaptative response/methylated-DNA-[protein]-cysteine methyltransferase
MINEEQCWEALQKRDAAQDGQFFFGVMTTGVFCRPSCPARRPLRKNVRFYATPADAEKDGLRPCLRCRPLATVNADPNTDLVKQMCQFIDQHSEENLMLNQLARKAGLSPFHFQRSFKAIAGVSPKQYLEACRLKNLKTQLRSGGQVTNAIFEAGYGSISRVYEKADTRLGMTPAEYRRGAKDVVITHVAVESPVGLMMIGATNRGICFIQLGDSEPQLRDALQKEYPGAKLELMPRPYPPQFHLWLNSLNEHLRGHQPHVDLPIDIRATAFQMKVWRYLQSIPYGEVQSYSEVASGIGAPTAARAVARACATNTVAIVIPCHRVIRGNGELGGYRWGLDRKRALIDRERQSKSAAG